MCLSSPKIRTPPPVQESKDPDLTALAKARKQNSTIAGGTLLTSPAGISSGSLNTGAPTLLGG